MSVVWLVDLQHIRIRGIILNGIEYYLRILLALSLPQFGSQSVQQEQERIEYFGEVYGGEFVYQVWCFIRLREWEKI